MNTKANDRKVAIVTGSATGVGAATALALSRRGYDLLIRGEPQESEALMEHDALRLLARNGEPAPWELSRGEARWEGIPPGRATANSPELLMRMARYGAGITAIAHHFAEPYMRSGDLEPVLEEWALPPAAAWAVFPGRRLMPARTRVFLDTLEAEFSGPRCQAQIAKERQTRRERFNREVRSAA